MSLKNTDSYTFDMNKLTNKLSILCQEINIKKWDLGGSSSQEISVQVQNGEAKQLKSSQRSSITIRVWNNQNQVGITVTSDITDDGLRKALVGAFEASKYGNKKESPEFSSLAKESLPDIHPIVNKLDGIDVLLEKLKNAESELISNHCSIDSVPYNGLSESTLERIYINSSGADRQMRISQASLYLYAKAQEKNKKPRSSGAVRIANSLKDLNIKSCIKEASEKTISHLNYQPIKTGKYLICFTPDAFLQLISAFSSMFNARSIIDGVSLFNKRSVGDTIAVSNLTIKDEGLHPKNIGAFPFDGEGTPTQNIVIIENGILRNLLHSEATAREFGVKPTGHAGIGAKVSVSPDWLVVENSNQESDHNLDINKQETYVLIESLSALHSGVKASQGSFSLPFDGWIVENGKKISIEAATIAGDILTILKNIIKIENEKIITTSGICPHVWVDEVSITGES